MISIVILHPDIRYTDIDDIRDMICVLRLLAVKNYSRVAGIKLNWLNLIVAVLEQVWEH